MDFGSLLNVAQKNEKTPKKEIQYYSTKFEPPKKEERTSKKLSDNIKKFLARKEAEEKKKNVEANAKREELLALRSQDKKATRRVSVMLKRTKSANKSVIQDAVDNDNTAVTLAGPSQPDEDDYGYVSQEASAYYNKMMAKYNNLPDEPKFSSSKKNVSVNLSGTKDRVRAALLKEQEEALLPHKRKRKSRIDDSEKAETSSSSQESTSFAESTSEKTYIKPKPKVAAPPPLNFHELLKIAEKKQFEPIVIEQKKKSDDDGKPMTKKQRREYEKDKAWQEHRERRKQAMESGKPIKPTEKTSMPPPMKIPKLSNGNNNMKIPKLSPTDDRPKNIQKPIPNNPKKNGNIVPERKPDPNKVSKLRTELEKTREPPKTFSTKPQSSSSQSNARYPEKQLSNKTVNPKASSTSDFKNTPKRDSNISKDINKSRSSIQNSATSSKISNERNMKPSSSDGKPKQFPPSDVRPKQFLPSDVRSKQFPPSDVRPKQCPPSDVRPKQFPPSDVRPKQFPPSDVRPKQFPPSDLKPKQFPPSDVRQKQFPPGDVRGRFPSKGVKRKPPMGHKRRILDDDDSEYDSEMDDFIDDEPAEGEDYSKYISEIFGYDKSKYRDRDDDDHTMESSFSQMMKEEFISSKLGLLEDLEDMKQEAIDKKRKAIRKKNLK